MATGADDEIQVGGGSGEARFARDVPGGVDDLMGGDVLDDAAPRTRRV